LYLHIRHTHYKCHSFLLCAFVIYSLEFHDVILFRSFHSLSSVPSSIPLSSSLAFILSYLLPFLIIVSIVLLTIFLPVYFFEVVVYSFSKSSCTIICHLCSYSED